MPNPPPSVPQPPLARQPFPHQPPRKPDTAPSFDALLRHLRQEVARVLQLPPEARAKEEPALISLYHRALARYGPDDRAALPPPLKQIDAYARVPNQADNLIRYLDIRRADLALDDEGDDKDGLGDDDLDSDEDAIGSEHPKSPSLGPTASPIGTAGNTTVSSPEPRSTVSAPPHRNADQKSSAAPAGSVNHTFTGDERCTNCIARNNTTCIVNSSRQRCDSCFVKRHRCSKVLTPPTRPTRDKSASVKGKTVEADTNGESSRAPKRKRTATEDDTKRTEAAKRPTRPTRPAAAASASAAGPSTSASAPVARPPAPKKPAMQNGNAVAPSAASAGSLAALAASASRAARAPTGPSATQPRHQYYQEKLSLISGILGMVQGAVKELQDQVNADAGPGR